MTRRTLAPLAALCLLAFAVRLGIFLVIFPPRLTGDELYYVDTALQIAQEGRHHSELYSASAVFPPGQALALATQVDAQLTQDYRHLQPTTLARFLILETALGTLLVLLIAVLGWNLFDRRTGLWAGVCAALYPTLVAFSHYLWSETLFMVLTVAALIAAVRAARTGGWAWVVASGLCFGAAALTREAAGAIAVAVALWWLWTDAPAAPGSARRRGAVARGLLLLFCVGLVVLPWTVRNHRQLDRLVPVSTVGWMGLREGNTFSGPGWLRPDMQALGAFRARYFAIKAETERMDMARREALSLIADHQPTWLAKKLLRNSAHFFAPDSFVFKKLSRGLYGDVPLGIARTILVLTVVCTLGVFLGGLLGCALAPGRAERLLPLLIAAAVFGVHLVANSSSRHRLALVPLALIYFAYAVQHRRRISSLSRNARIVLAILAAGIVIWPAVYFAPDAASLWVRGSYVDPHRY